MDKRSWISVVFVCCVLESLQTEAVLPGNALISPVKVTIFDGYVYDIKQVIPGLEAGHSHPANITPEGHIPFLSSVNVDDNKIILKGIYFADTDLQEDHKSIKNTLVHLNFYLPNRSSQRLSLNIEAKTKSSDDLECRLHIIAQMWLEMDYNPEQRQPLIDLMEKISDILNYPLIWLHAEPSHDSHTGPAINKSTKVLLSFMTTEDSCPTEVTTLDIGKNMRNAIESFESGFLQSVVGESHRTRITEFWPTSYFNVKYAQEGVSFDVAHDINDIAMSNDVNRSDNHSEQFRMLNDNSPTHSLGQHEESTSVETTAQASTHSSLPSTMPSTQHITQHSTLESTRPGDPPVTSIFKSLLHHLTDTNTPTNVLSTSSTPESSSAASTQTEVSTTEQVTTMETVSSTILTTETVPSTRFIADTTEQLTTITTEVPLTTQPSTEPSTETTPQLTTTTEAPSTTGAHRTTTTAESQLSTTTSTESDVSSTAATQIPADFDDLDFKIGRAHSATRILLSGVSTQTEAVSTDVSSTNAETTVTSEQGTILEQSFEPIHVVHSTQQQSTHSVLTTDSTKLLADGKLQAASDDNEVQRSEDTEENSNNDTLVNVAGNPVTPSGSSDDRVSSVLMPIFLVAFLLLAGLYVAWMIVRRAEKSGFYDLVRGDRAHLEDVVRLNPNETAPLRPFD